MDLSSPISSVIPSGHGVVLSVLARSEQPVSGRRVAELTDGRLSSKGVLNVLNALVEAGVVLVEDQPPARLFRLNRRHLAAQSILDLADLRGRLIEELRGHLGSWAVPAEGAWLFGSLARGEGSADSDIDVLLVRPDRVSDDDPSWLAQVEAFIEDVTAWSGNACSIIEYSLKEFTRMMASPGRLPDDLRAQSMLLAGEMQLRDLRPRRAS